MAGGSDPIAELREAVTAGAAELHGDGALGEPRFERPPKPDFGDYSTNAAMLLAPALGEPPRVVAEKLGGVLSEQLGRAIERVEVAGPGFLNLFMSDDWCHRSLAVAIAAGEGYGGGTADPRERIHLEFVSANPTGPLHVGSARHAAFGDSLGRILEFLGHEVHREYYVNDAGSQVRLFGESIRARARGEEPPQDGYRGAYLEELAAEIRGAADADPDELAVRGIELMLERIEATLARFRVRFDRFFSERELHARDAVNRAIGVLEEREHVYQSEGAVWLRSTTFGDDKDRVLMRSSGEFTYFGADIAYHEAKLERDFDRYINVLGADHHGYVERIKAAWEALGGERDRLDVPIMQLVHLTERGERVQMSKRTGELVTLDDLLDDIGVDAARFFLLQRNHDTTLDLDLALARERSQENPVYYVQYAHARIASILRKAGEERVTRALDSDLAESREQLHPSARALLKQLLEFPGELTTAGERRAPHRLTTYVHDVAQQFSAFYRDCRVIGAAEEGGDEDFRLALSVQSKRVIGKSLELLGVEAPEQM
jgi:arginyl-tRNA synthetase